jgi:hypothetical protein
MLTSQLAFGFIQICLRDAIVRFKPQRFFIGSDSSFIVFEEIERLPQSSMSLSKSRRQCNGATGIYRSGGVSL